MEERSRKVMLALDIVQLQNLTKNSYVNLAIREWHCNVKILVFVSPSSLFVSAYAGGRGVVRT